MTNITISNMELCHSDTAALGAQKIGRRKPHKTAPQYKLSLNLFAVIYGLRILSGLIRSKAIESNVLIGGYIGL